MLSQLRTTSGATLAEALYTGARTASSAGGSAAIEAAMALWRGVTSVSAANLAVFSSALLLRGDTPVDTIVPLGRDLRFVEKADGGGTVQEFDPIDRKWVSVRQANLYNLGNYFVVLSDEQLAKYRGGTVTLPTGDPSLGGTPGYSSTQVNGGTPGYEPTNLGTSTTTSPIQQQNWRDLIVMSNSRPGDPSNLELPGMSRPVRLPSTEFPPDPAATSAMGSLEIQRMAGFVDNVDCSEIAERLQALAGGKGFIIRVDPTLRYGLNVFENGKIAIDQAYHEVYTDGGYVFDPRLATQPIPLGDWYQHMNGINPGGGHHQTEMRKSMSNEMADGDELLEFIRTLGELEWAKFEARQPMIATRGGATTEDRSSHPPYTSFRFKNESPVLIQKLIELVHAYRGLVEWVVLRHDRSPLPGTNWSILPKLAEGLREEAVSLNVPVWTMCERRMPGLGPMAYKDLLGLVAHLKAVW